MGRYYITNNTTLTMKEVGALIDDSNLFDNMRFYTNNKNYAIYFRNNKGCVNIIVEEL